MTDATLIADLIRSGLDPELIQRVTMALIESKGTAAVAILRDDAADRRRESDRLRKAKLREAVCGNLRNSTESADSADKPSPPPSSSPQVSPRPPSSPTPTSAPTPVREAPAAVATDGGLNLGDKPSKPDPKPRKEKPTDPRHAEFVKLYTEAWAETFGGTYPFHVSDAGQLSSLLKTSDLTAEELMLGVSWCWKQITENPRAEWAVKQASTIRGFCTNFASILAANKAAQIVRR